MDYEFLNSAIEQENITLPKSDKINPILLKSNQNEILKAIDFLSSSEKFLYIHGFLGTGKRQFINYVCEFLNKDVIKLEYYCKEATVCDDILLAFIDEIENQSISKAVNLNAKITTLAVKFQQMISSIKKPFVIILHSFDDIDEKNRDLVVNCLTKVLAEENVKLILSTRAMDPSVMGDVDEDRKIFLKALPKEIFKEFILSNGINATDRVIEDFYNYTRGYYYYTALSIKIIQAMKIELSEFLQKFAQSEMSFDSYLGITYINLIPTAIRNFFWFLRTIRHGLTLNALAIFDIYDEFSLDYLRTNLMIFQSGETIYVQDFFLQKIDISIPEKTEIKLHKYIIGIYEKQLKEQLKSRSIMISKQALRSEIEYHTNCIHQLESGVKEVEEKTSVIQEEKEQKQIPETLAGLLDKARELSLDKKFTEAIEQYKKILEDETIDLTTLVEVRKQLAGLYKEVGEYSNSSHYYDLVEVYYRTHSENINLNYLYYDMTDLYFKMYKNDRAIETIKKVIYSTDTPQSLMVAACTLLGNIYSEINNPNEAYSYYKKALESLDENTDENVKGELYFKYALANDDKGDMDEAYEYYNKCIALSGNNPYKASAYSNLASCYFENNSFDDARSCFEKAYSIEKSANNYDGIYYIASNLAKIYIEEGSDKACDYLIEAKKSAEFINEEFYILESSLALGDYYYNKPDYVKNSLVEYFKSKKLAEHLGIDTVKIEQRINDMKFRMSEEDFKKLESRYNV